MKRYNVKCYGYAKVVESDKGQWVTWEDVQALNDMITKECRDHAEFALKTGERITKLENLLRKPNGC